MRVCMSVSVYLSISFINILWLAYQRHERYACAHFVYSQTCTYICTYTYIFAAALCTHEHTHTCIVFAHVWVIVLSHSMAKVPAGQGQQQLSIHNFPLISIALSFLFTRASGVYVFSTGVLSVALSFGSLIYTYYLYSCLNFAIHF